jgi:hypothetical protein
MQRPSLVAGHRGLPKRSPVGRAGLGVALPVLMLAAAACALPVAGRPLVWLDAVTVAAGVTVLAFLYGAIDASLAHAPRLRALGGRA